MSNLQKLRGVILDLTYVEMMIFASWFANTDVSEEQQGDEAFWAFTINDWASNVELHDDDTALASTGGEHHAE